MVEAGACIRVRDGSLDALYYAVVLLMKSTCQNLASIGLRSKIYEIMGDGTGTYQHV